jgi:uncharacterized membrane protein
LDKVFGKIGSNAGQRQARIDLNRLDSPFRRVDMRGDFAEKRREGHMIASLSRVVEVMVAGRLRAGAAAGVPCVALVATLAVMASAAPARADFRVCNATQNLVGVGIGYRAKAGWITEGWWHIDGSSCKTLIEGPLSSRFYYLYAEDAERGGRWDGPINMCVAEKEFKIAGVNDCVARGFQRAGFQEYDTGEQASWMVQLTDQPASGGEGAAADNKGFPESKSQ